MEDAGKLFIQPFSDIKLRKENHKNENNSRKKGRTMKFKYVLTWSNRIMLKGFISSDFGFFSNLLHLQADY